MVVGGQSPGGVRGTPANTTKLEFGSHPGYENEIGNVVVDQMPTKTSGSAQDDPHEGQRNRAHEKNDSVGPSTNSVESEGEERGTTVRESDSHGMAVGKKGENKENNTRQYGE